VKDTLLMKKNTRNLIKEWVRSWLDLSQGARNLAKDLSDWHNAAKKAYIKDMGKLKGFSAEVAKIYAIENKK
jgi:hypothetical protein